MRSLRVKLLSCLAVVCLAVALLVVGIWAAGTQTINLKGQVDFTINDPSLYVKDIRIKNSMEDASSEGDTIDNFVPGYVNTTMNLNLGQIDNSTGGLSIYIDIINTTDTTYVASTTSSISGAEITVGGTIDGDGIPQSDILTTDTPSGTIEIVISAPDIATLDLGQISISLDELTYNVSANDPTLGSVSFSVDGDQVTLTATLNNNTEFLGWAENTEDGYVVCDLPTYTFTSSPDTAMTYVALFREYLTIAEGGMLDYNFSGSNATVWTASYANINGGDVIIPSTINVNGALYTVTSIGGYVFAYGSVTIDTLVIPSTMVSTTTGEPAFEQNDIDKIYIRSGTSYFWDDFFYNASPIMIVDSYSFYSGIHSFNVGGSIDRDPTFKILQSIDDGSNTYLSSSTFTKTGTEVINGRTYNVYVYN